jgi:hypothetical protein
MCYPIIELEMAFSHFPLKFLMEVEVRSLHIDIGTKDCEIALFWESIVISMPAVLHGGMREGRKDSLFMNYSPYRASRR